MPIYEYRCKDCEDRFEELTLSANDGKSVRCRKCASRKVERLLSAFAVHAGAPTAVQSAGCGACGAPRRGMCGES